MSNIILTDATGKLGLSGKREIPMERLDVAAFSHFDAGGMFTRLHVTPVCVDCMSSIRGANSPDDRVIVAECECTRRVWRQK